jgi:hypothetical protein
MNTTTSPCIVQFVGGPCDGLVLTDLHFEQRDTVRMPGRPANGECSQSDAEFVGSGTTAYELTIEHRTIDAGQPTKCLRYDFRGYEGGARSIEGAACRRPGSQRLLGLRNRCSRLSRRFADWMLEPIDYPLKMPMLPPTDDALISVTARRP